jgi:hypothetical protein
LPNLSSASLNENQFYIEKDYILSPKQSTFLKYDNATQKWLFSQNADVSTSNRRTPIYSWDYHLAGVSTANFASTAIGSGTAAYVNSVTNHPGYMRTTSSTSANSGTHSYLYNLTNMHVFKGGEVYECIYQPRVSNNINTTTRFGFMDATTITDAVDGAYFEIPVNSLNVVGKTSNNNTRTTSSSIATLTVNTWYRFKATVNRDATSILFEIFNEDGSLLGTSQTITTNIPTVPGRDFGIGYITTNSGTVATQLGWLDYQSVSISDGKPLNR